MEHTKEVIIEKAYHLLKSTIPMLEGLPRSQKFTLGDRIQNHLSDLLEFLIRAYYSPSSEKRPILNQINIHLEILRYYFRLGYERGHYNSLKYQELAEKTDEIGRITGGWLKSLRS